VLLYSIALILGFVLLLWSADKFVDGASSVATHLGMSRLLVGMVIVGFGTSAPEMLVSALAAFDGKPGLAFGNLYGSNITNLSLVLGIAILIRPVDIERNIVVRELPILLAVTLLSAALLWDLEFSRLDAFISLLIFAGIMFASIRRSMREKKRYDEIKNQIGKHGKSVILNEIGGDAGDEISSNAGDDADAEVSNNAGDDVDDILPIKNPAMWLILGLIVLVASSQLLVWSAIGLATTFGVSDVIIGLTIVAIGTSLPELATVIAATRKKEHSLVIGNILGSNFFNTLMGVGIAGIIHPLAVEPAILYRDLALVIGLTFLLFIFCSKGGTRKNRILLRYEGSILVFIYVLYISYLISIVLGKPLINFY